MKRAEMSQKFKPIPILTSEGVTGCNRIDHPFHFSFTLNALSLLISGPATIHFRTMSEPRPWTLRPPWGYAHFFKYTLVTVSNILCTIHHLGKGVELPFSDLNFIIYVRHVLKSMT